MKTKRRRGRPTKFNEKSVRAICRAVADGLPLKFAAATGGISHETLCQWREQYPEFSEAIEAALAKGIHTRLKIINGAAREGNLKAAMWWLEHVMAEWFSPNRLTQKPSVETEPENKPRVVITIPSNGTETYLNRETGEWEPVKYPRDFNADDCGTESASRPRDSHATSASTTQAVVQPSL